MSMCDINTITACVIAVIIILDTSHVTCVVITFAARIKPAPHGTHTNTFAHIHTRPRGIDTCACVQTTAHMMITACSGRSS